MPEQQGTLFLKHTQIVIHWTDGSQQVFPLQEVTRIGRGKNGNDIAVPEVFLSVSRRHLEIRHEKDGYRLIDLGSRNGVLINGLYIKDAYLRDGDEIRIGQDEQGHDIRIEFQLGSEALLSDIQFDEHSTIPPAAGLVSESPLNTPHFKVRWYNGRINYFPMFKDRVVIGRGPDADLRVPETLRFVSGQQVEVLNRTGEFLVRDLNSTNGTLLNNQRMLPGQFYPLVHDAILRFGDDEFGISVGFTFINPKAKTRAMDGFLQAAPATEVATIQHVLIGRLSTCNLILDHPEVSRRHALIRKIEGKYFIEDLDSSNGTRVNDNSVKHAELHNGDLIRISSFTLLFLDGQLIPYQSSGVRLDVCGLSRDVKTKTGTQRVLDTINLSILPRELVALIGANKSGTSALLDAISGIRPGTGDVRFNGHDFYREYQSIRSQVGYVPQVEILHTDLTVEAALDYASRLRLPTSLTAAERQHRIYAVLETVSMNMPAIRDTRISNLSNVERKRINIAAELLADPKIIYLDNPTADLDPGLEKKMMHMFRQIADEGRTVVLTAEATNNIVQTDHVAFLSEGKLVYFGPSDEALNFFEVEEFADIYECIDGKGEPWRKVFEQKKPEHYKKYVEDRQKSLAGSPRHTLPKTHFGINDYVHQFFVLTQRALRLLASQRMALVSMLLLFPITALLQLLIAKPDVLTGKLALLADPLDVAKTMTTSYTPGPATSVFIFLMGIEALFAGLLLPTNDLIRERLIFQRERMLNLKVLPYLSSKVFLYSNFAVIQVLLYLIILSLGVNIPTRGLYVNGYVELFISLFLTMMAGISLGLVISAVSRSTEVATYILLATLVFQFLFAGTLFDLRGKALEPLSNLAPAHWSVTALGVTIDMHKIAQSTILCNEVHENPSDPNSTPKMVCLPAPEAKNDLFLNYSNDQLLWSWSVLIGITILCLGIGWILLARQNPSMHER